MKKVEFLNKLSEELEKRHGRRPETFWRNTRSTST